MTRDRLLRYISGIEKGVAVVVLFATAIYAAHIFPYLFTLDWRESATYFIVLEYILHIIIGVELARLLIDYSLETLVELLAFIFARKILLPDGTSVDLLLSVISIMFLFITHQYVLRARGK